jgi:hypothetical protein
MFASVPPRRGDHVQNWDWLKLDPGKAWHGWCAGPMIGVECHHRGQSRPCRKRFTDGALSCPDCVDKLPVTWRGYMPLWDDAGARFLSIFGDRYYDDACEVRFLRPVTVRKNLARGCPIRCGVSTRPLDQLPVILKRRRPADVRPYLLKLWKDLELSRWCAKHPVPDLPDTPVSGLQLTEEEARGLDGVITNRLRERIKVVPSRASGGPPLAERNAEFLAAHTSRNGKAEKK